MKYRYAYAVWLPAIFGALVTNQAVSHEYWLDPIDASVRAGTSMIVDVRNGENFEGASFPYNVGSFMSVTVSGGGTSQPYTGRLGDYPAFHQQLDEHGLYGLVVNGTDRDLTYKSWDQFTEFLTYHGLDAVRAEHQQRQLPTVGVIERYRRNAKTLLQVTSDGVPEAVTPQQSATAAYLNNAVFIPAGDEFEMILLNNPYEDTEQVGLQLLYKGKPLADRQVELFWRGKPLERFTQVTDGDGKASFKLLGDGDYLLNAVHVIEPPAGSDAHWYSRWSTITFERRVFD